MVLWMCLCMMTDTTCPELVRPTLIMTQVTVRVEVTLQARFLLFDSLCTPQVVCLPE